MGRPSGIGKYETARGSGLVLVPRDGRVARPAGDYAPKRGEQVWCYLCNAAHRFHGLTELAPNEREAV